MKLNSDFDELLALRARLAVMPDGRYVDRHDEPRRHPAALYSRSLAKVLQRMHEVAKLVPSRRPVAGAPQDWSRLMAALELLFVAVDSHADDLKALLQIVNPRLAPKTAKQSASQIDDVFEELVGRPFNRMRHHGENLEARICYSNQFSLYGYL